MKPRQQILYEHCANSCSVSCEDETRLYSIFILWTCSCPWDFLFELNKEEIG